MKLAPSIPDSGGTIRLKGGRDRGSKELDGDVHSQPDRLTGRKQGREMHACGRGDGGGGGGVRRWINIKPSESRGCSGILGV